MVEVELQAVFVFGAKSSVLFAGQKKEMNELQAKALVEVEVQAEAKTLVEHRAQFDTRALLDTVVWAAFLADQMIVCMEAVQRESQVCFVFDAVVEAKVDELVGFLLGQEAFMLLEFFAAVLEQSEAYIVLLVEVSVSVQIANYLVALVEALEQAGIYTEMWFEGGLDSKFDASLTEALEQFVVYNKVQVEILEVAFGQVDIAMSFEAQIAVLGTFVAYTDKLFVALSALQAAMEFEALADIFAAMVLDLMF